MVVRNLKEQILKTISQSKIPLSTTDISSKLSVSWHSIQTRCLKLQIEGKVNGLRIGKMNLWTLK